MKQVNKRQNRNIPSLTKVGKWQSLLNRSWTPLSKTDLHGKRRNVLKSQIRQKKEATEQELKEKQEWQKIAEAKEAEAKTLQQQLEALNRKQLQADIAAKIGLPSTLASRLQGNTAEELEADAKDYSKPYQKLNKSRSHQVYMRPIPVVKRHNHK